MPASARGVAGQHLGVRGAPPRGAHAQGRVPHPRLDDINRLVHRIEDLLLAAKTGGFADQALFDAAFSGFDIVQLAISADITRPLDGSIRKTIDQYIRAIEPLIGGGEEEEAEGGESSDGSHGAGENFTETALERLECLSQCLMQLEEVPDNATVAEELLREIHSLKGEARMLGADTLSQFARMLEVLLLAARDTGFTSQAHFDAAFAGFDLARAVLAAPEDSQTQRHIEAYTASISSLIPADEGESAPAPPTPAAAEEPEPAVSASPFPPELLEEFQAASQTRLERLSQCLLQLEESPGNASVSEELLREAHTLKGESRILGLDDINRLVHRIEDLLLAAKTGGFADQALFDAAFSASTSSSSPSRRTSPGPSTAASERPSTSTSAQSSPLIGGGEEEEAEGGEGAGEGGAVAAPVVAAPAPPAPAPTEPPAAAAPPAGGGARKQQSARREFLQVPVERVEHLVHLSGDLQLRQNQQSRLVNDLDRLVGDWLSTVKQYSAEGRLEVDVNTKLVALARELGARLRDMRDDSFQNGLRLSEMQDAISGIQLVEVRSAFAKYPRAVRSMCRELGKECAVVLEGVEGSRSTRRC